MAPLTYSAVGARWIRAALQVNPFEYKGQNSPSSRFPDEATYNSKLIAGCKAANIELIAVTDHWSVDTAAGLVQAATDAGLVALPGFEANTSEGIHLLVIFEQGTDLSNVNAAIGLCGAQPGCSNGTTGASFKEILRTMSQQGALVVPAHTNVPNSGMLTGRTGEPLVQMILNPDLHAIGITPSVDEARDQSLIVAGTKPFDRIHPLAVVYADDVSHPDTLKSDGATTWFKVSSPCLESLKLAVRTPVTRVSTRNPTATPRAILREISWTGGFLDGVTLPLADDLTALIGGRGTGKSTVIESIRYTLDMEPSGETVKRDHEGIVGKVLNSGTTIRLVVDAVVPTARRFTIERSVPNPPIVYDASGTVTNQKPLDIIGQVEIFGQHELAELAQDKTSVARMLERFSGNWGPDEECAGLLRQLRDNRDRLGRLENDRSELANELADVPRLEEQVKRFEETNLPERLEEQRRLTQDEALFAEGSRRLTEARTLVEELRVDERLDNLRADLDDIEGSSQEATLQKVVAAVARVGDELQRIVASLEGLISTAESEIADAKSEWTGLTEPMRAGHAEVRRQLVEEGHDPDKYLTSTQALEKLKAKSQRMNTLDGQISALLAERRRLVGELGANESRQSERLNGAIRAANGATQGIVVVRPVASPERSAIKKMIERHVKGQRTQIMAAIDADEFSPRGFVAAARSGTEDLESDFGVRGAQATSVVAAGEDLYRELEEMSVGQAVDVLLNVAPSGEVAVFHRLEDLSKGQRATALLLLLLGASSSPLVIDQPEDDLDNRFVYDGVVHKLRELKGERQIIASTHNANVPVLGDAELIITLEGDGLKGWPREDGVGSLDDPKIREYAEQLLEGGKAAFDARQHLYGF